MHYIRKQHQRAYFCSYICILYTTYMHYVIYYVYIKKHHQHVYFCSNTCVYIYYTPGTVAESVEYWSRVWEIVGSNPSRVKPMTNKIDACHFLARCSTLLG